MNLSKLSIAFQILHKFGFFSGVKYILHRLIAKSTVFIKTKNIKIPVKIRFATTDVHVFEQIFLFNEYGFDIDFEPNFIIDAGANVGYSAIYFANRFPNSKIISIEPEEKNFEILKENIKHYPNIYAINSALWPEEEELYINDRGTGAWGFNVKADKKSDTQIRSTTITKLIEESEFDIIDILKIDIEGSEKALFERSYKNWINKTRLISVEIHDYIEKGSSKAIFNAFSQYHFDLSQRGEYLIFTNTNL